MGKTTGAEPPPAGRGPPRWIWMVGVIVVTLLVVWQLSTGLFVKSVTGPDGTGMTFAPRDDSTANNASPGQDLGNVVDQGGGNDNQTDINGSDNHVSQHGTGNTATIGGLPPNWKPPGDGSGSNNGD